MKGASSGVACKVTCSELAIVKQPGVPAQTWTAADVLGKVAEALDDSAMQAGLTVMHAE